MEATTKKIQTWFLLCEKTQTVLIIRIRTAKLFMSELQVQWMWTHAGAAKKETDAAAARDHTNQQNTNLQPHTLNVNLKSVIMLGGGPQLCWVFTFDNLENGTEMGSGFSWQEWMLKQLFNLLHTLCFQTCKCTV